MTLPKIYLANMKKMTLFLLLASLVSTMLSPDIRNATADVIYHSQQQTGWYINDTPSFGPEGYNTGWRGGDPKSYGRGYGPARYYANSNYIYASAAGEWNPNGSWATWTMGNRVGKQAIKAYIPSNHATARVRYKITIGSTTKPTSTIHQADLSGWTDLGDWWTNGQPVKVAVYYNDSAVANGKSGAWWRSVGVDAMQMRCTESCTGTKEPIRPDRPDVSLRSDRDQISARWSADDNGFPIDRWQYRWKGSKSYTVSANKTSRTWNGVANGRYTLQIRVHNAGGWSLWGENTVTVNDRKKPIRPDRPVVGLKSDGDQISARWKADDNGFPIDRWQYRWKGGKRSTVSANNKSRTWNGLKNGRYTLQVRARNAGGWSFWGEDTVTVNKKKKPRCPTSGKYKIVSRGNWPFRTHRVQALKQFKPQGALKSVTIGRKGGRTRDNFRNLSQSGCSWVNYDSVLEDEARVLDNARVYGNVKVSDDAKISGDSRVYGKAKVYNSAKVFDNARVYGNAKVFKNAQVYENARVYGYAKIHGSAQISGNAKVYGNANIAGTAEIGGGANIGDDLTIREGIFDGRQEHIRTWKQLLKALKKDLRFYFGDVCRWSADEVERNIDYMLNPKHDRAYLKSAIVSLQGCKQVEFYLNLLNSLPGPAEMIISMALPLIGSLGKLPLFVKSLLAIAEAADTVKQFLELHREFEKLLKNVDYSKL